MDPDRLPLPLLKRFTLTALAMLRTRAKPRLAHHQESYNGALSEIERKVQVATSLNRVGELVDDLCHIPKMYRLYWHEDGSEWLEGLIAVKVLFKTHQLERLDWVGFVRSYGL